MKTDPLKILLTWIMSTPVCVKQTFPKGLPRESSKI